MKKNLKNRIFELFVLINLLFNFYIINFNFINRRIR